MSAPWLRAVADLLVRKDRDAAAMALEALGPLASPADESLRLHLRALLSFGAGRRAAASADLEHAAALEQAQGWIDGAQHTSHQWALLSPGNGSLARSKKYYAESTRHLRTAKNWLGAGLCARSLGELALVVGQARQALSLWRTASLSLGRASAAEATQVAGWIDALQISLETDDPVG